MIQESNENYFLNNKNIFCNFGIYLMSISEMKTHPDIPPCHARPLHMDGYLWKFTRWKVIACELRLLIQLRAFFFPVVFSWAAARCSVRRHIQNIKIDFFPVRMLSVARTLVCYIIASAPIHLSLNQATNQLQSRKKLSHVCLLADNAQS